MRCSVLHVCLCERILSTWLERVTRVCGTVQSVLADINVTLLETKATDVVLHWCTVLCRCMNPTVPLPECALVSMTVRCCCC